MDNNIQNALKAIGLNDTEIKVYLGLLQFGTTSASVLAKRLGMSRSTVRHNLQQLAKKQLAIMSKKNGSFFFTPEDPQRILRIITQEKEELQKKEKGLQSIIGALQGMMNPHISVPKVEFFEGEEGVKRAYLQLLEEVDNTQHLLSYAYPLEEKNNTCNFLHIVRHFIENRVKRKIPIRVIFVGTKKAYEYHKRDKEEYRTTRFLDKMYWKNTSVSYGGEFFIYKDTTFAFCVGDNFLFAYKVTHPFITEMQRNMFHALWDTIPGIK